MTDPDYESLKKMPLESLIAYAAGGGLQAPREIAKFVYDQRMMEQQYEYTKQQIELQHLKNMQLLSRQLRWLKWSAILNLIGLLAAVLLGWFLQEWKSKSILSTSKQQNIQSQTEPSISVPHSEQKVYKVPSLQPPKKNEIHK